MAIDVSILEAAGWHASVEEVAAHLNAQLATAVRPRRRVMAADVMPMDELAAWRDLGVDLDERFEGLPAAVDTAAAMTALYVTALTPQQAADRLGVDRSRISHRIADGTLYAMRLNGHPRLPLFQFTDDLSALVPSFQLVAPHLADLYPLSVYNWFTLPDRDLLVGEDETPTSPRTWLLEGRDPAPVVESARWLNDPGRW